MTEATKTEAPSNIYTALAAAQAEMANVSKDAKNPHFKSTYASLANVVSAVRPVLAKHGIAFFHTSERDEISGQSEVTVLIHGESGTDIRSAVPLMVGKNDMQGYKSAVTYARRIGLEGLTGIAPEDDDGNDAAKSRKGNPAGDALREAWRDAVLDSLPDSATDAEKAQAFADAICRDFENKGTPRSTRALDNAWDNHKAMIGTFQNRYPELHEQVVNAYENRKNDLTPRLEVMPPV